MINENELIEEIKANFHDFSTNILIWQTKKTKAAAARARKASLKLRKLLKEWKAVNIIGM
jgi:hypothetical protein